MKTARRQAREIALQALYAWQLSGGDPLEEARALEGFEQDRRALRRERCCRGVREPAPRRCSALIAPHLDREFGRLSPVERAILYIGASSWPAHPETPFKVVLNEAVELGKSFGGDRRLSLRQRRARKNRGMRACGPRDEVAADHASSRPRLNEFELIRRFFDRPPKQTLLGVGDDCALLRPDAGLELAVTTDMLVEGRHFLAGADPRALGHKALAVNLSDLAAMGAAPRWAHARARRCPPPTKAGSPRSRPASSRSPSATASTSSAATPRAARSVTISVDGARRSAFGRGDVSRRRARRRRHLGLRRARRRGARADAIPRSPRRAKRLQRARAARRARRAPARPRARRDRRVRRPGRRSAAHPRALARGRRSCSMPSIPRLRRLRATERPAAREATACSRAATTTSSLFTAPRERAQANSTRFRRELGLPLTRIGAIQSGQPRLAVRRRGGQADARIRGGFDHFAQPMIVLRPTPAFAFSHPAHVVAFGFGAGLAPRRARNVRHAGRLGCSGWLLAGAASRRSFFRSSRALFLPRRLGLRASPGATSACTTTARWCGTRSSRSCSCSALLPREPAMAGGRRSSCSASSTSASRRRSAGSSGAGSGGFGVMFDDLLAAGYTLLVLAARASGCSSDGRSRAKKLGARLKARERDAGHGRVVHRRLGGAGRDLGGRLVGLVRARLRHLFQRGEAGAARRARRRRCARTAR